MAIRNVSKKMLSCKIVMKVYNVYYDVLYKYSHKKFYKLIDQQWFKIIFKEFAESGNLHTILASDKTLCANVDSYKGRLEEIIVRCNQ